MPETEAGQDGDRRPPPSRVRSLLKPSDGARLRRLSLELAADGGLTLRFHDLGGELAAVWGADDREVTVRLDARAASRLAFGLVAEHLAGRADAVEALQALCETHDVEAQIAEWT